MKGIMILLASSTVLTLIALGLAALILGARWK